MSSDQTETQSIFGLYYTGDGTRDGSLGGAPSEIKIPNGELNNFFPFITDDLAFTGGKRFIAIVLKNEGEEETSLKTSFVVELPSDNQDVSFDIAISSTGINQAPVMLADNETEPVTENFIPAIGKPMIANIGDLRAGDYIGIIIRMTVKTGAQEAKGVTAIFSAIGESTPKENPNPTPDPCPANHHRDISTGECIPNDCDPGFKWDPGSNGGLGGCVPDDTPIECPLGQHYDETLQQCVEDELPPPITFRNFAAVIAGDFDCNSRTDRTFEEIQATINQVAGFGDPTYLFLLGDYSYGSSQSCFLQRIDALTGIGLDQIFPAIGNHDDRESGSTTKRNAILNHFPATANNQGIYALTLGPIRLIVMNTQDDYDEGSTQHNFVVQQLQNARADGQIKWIIVTYHKPSIVSDDPDHGPLTDFRDIYHPLFDQYKVNVVLNGHNHIYHRSYPLLYNASSPRNPIVASLKTGDNDTPGQLYTGDEGTIYVTVGTGGRRLDSFSGSQENYIFVREEENGVLKLSVFNNGDTLAFFFHAHNGDQLDEFYISKIDSW